MKSKKLWSILIITVIAMSTFLLKRHTAMAYDGNGTKESPYLLHSLDDFYEIPADSEAYYQLANDIDMKNYKKEPFGNFKGTIDGNQYTIKNLNIVSGVGVQNIGFFSTLEGAVIKNIVFDTITISALGDYAGILAGTASQSSFENCTVINSTITGKNHTGALIGKASQSSFERCGISSSHVKGLNNTGALLGSGTEITLNKCTLLEGTVEGSDYIGLVGHGTTTTVEKCNIQDSSFTGKNYIGLIGYGKELDMDHCFVTNSTLSGAQYIGSLIGYTVNPNPQKQSYIYGKNNTIIGTEYIGGLCGGSFRTDLDHSFYIGDPIEAKNFVGGLHGHATHTNLTKCYSNVNIKASGYSAGGLIGYASGTNLLKESFAIGTLEGNYSGGLIGFIFSTSSTTIENSYFKGSISNVIDFAGGIACHNATLINCYSASTISTPGTSKFGLCMGDKITNSYFDEDLSEITTPAYQSRSTETMKRKVNYYNWDFDTIWEIENGNDYPKLRFESLEPPVDPPVDPPEEEKRLKVVLEPAEGLQLSVMDDLEENKNYSWISSNTDIITISSTGMLNAVTNGKAIITVQSMDGKYKEEIQVLVINNAKTARMAIDLRVGTRCRLTMDDTLEMNSITWFSNDTSVATVSENGKVTALTKNLALIVAKDGAGKEIGQVYIRVR